MTTKIEEYLNRMKEIGDAATPGPIKIDYEGSEDSPDKWHLDGKFYVGQIKYKPDAEFIATARNNWDRLIEMNKVLLEACKNVRDFFGYDIEHVSGDWKILRGYAREVIGGSQQAIEQVEKILEGQK